MKKKIFIIIKTWNSIILLPILIDYVLLPDLLLQRFGNVQQTKFFIVYFVTFWPSVY